MGVTDDSMRVDLEPDGTCATAAIPGTVCLVVVDPARMHRDAFRQLAGETVRFDCVGSGESFATIPKLGRVDAILFHVAAPGPDLVGELALARERHPRATIVVLAGDVDAHVEHELVQRGASAVVSTSLGLDEVFAALCDLNGDELHQSVTADARVADVAAEYGITDRQLNVLGRLSEGRTPQQIAHDAGISLATVRDHLKQLRAKLDCSTAVELVVTAHRVGLLPNLARPLR